MATRFFLHAAALAAACVPVLALAHGNVSCDEPRAQWQARVDLQKQLKKQGWSIRDIRIENGCYEVYGFDEKRAKVEAFFNPRTFQRVYPVDAAPPASPK